MVKSTRNSLEYSSTLLRRLQPTSNKSTFDDPDGTKTRYIRRSIQHFPDLSSRANTSCLSSKTLLLQHYHHCSPAKSDRHQPNGAHTNLNSGLFSDRYRSRRRHSIFPMPILSNASAMLDVNTASNSAASSLISPSKTCPLLG